MILGFSSQYPRGHSRCGDATGFVDKIAARIKRHTMRDSAERFEKALRNRATRADGKVMLNIYTGVRTAASTFYFDLEYTGSQKVEMWRDQERRLFRVWVDGKELDAKEVEKLWLNDGFDNEPDFVEWMFLGQPWNEVYIAIKYLIHWTDLRY